MKLGMEIAHNKNLVGVDFSYDIISFLFLKLILLFKTYFVSRLFI